MACKKLTVEEYQDLIRRNPQAVAYDAEGQCDCAVLCFKTQYGRYPGEGYNGGGIGDCGDSPCPPDYIACLDCTLPENAGNLDCSLQTDGTGLDRTNGTFSPWPDWFCANPAHSEVCGDPPAFWSEEDSFLTITVAGACSECG
jgi:hypothetical protein